MSNAKTIGILGGMGPQASCELYRLVNEKSCLAGRAAHNADFPHLLLNSLPVPDLIRDRDAEQKTVAMARDGAFALQRAGATDILMSCNTMHLFQKTITEGLNTRFHSLIDIVATSMKTARKVLLLGSSTTIEAGLYQKALKKQGILYQEPSDALRNQSVDVILATIGQNLMPHMVTAYTETVLQEARNDPEIDTIGLVCTELPLAFPPKLKDFCLISSLNEAANYVVSLHFGR